MTELGANVIIKWSKTIQDGIHIHTIPIPLLGKSPACPYKALKLLLQSISGEPNDLLFTVSRSHGAVPLTNSVARRHLHSVSHILRLSPSLKCHDFRRSGVTWACHNGVPLHHTMHHGTWKSDLVWEYIQSTPQLVFPVSSTFQHFLHL